MDDDEAKAPKREPQNAEHGDVPEDLLELFEVLEWQAAVGR